MFKLVLIRHGESTWNKENRFTGWTDVDLSERGFKEALEAGKKLKEAGFNFRFAYTSFLKRAIKTLNIILEKHYGILQGLNKTEMVEKYGEKQVLIWRRSYDVRPPALDDKDERHPKNSIRYANLTEEGSAPGTEALIDTVARIVPFWKSDISEKLKEHKEVIVAAHGNSLRGIVKYLKNISDEDIISLNLPTGIPYVFEFDENMKLVKDYFLADEETLKKLMEEVANQGKKK
jgi:2,3-bisphosphoglycerate-dependent phosphoglycerate mutase